PERFGRERLSRRAGGDCERGQRCAEAARDQGDEPADQGGAAGRPDREGARRSLADQDDSFSASLSSVADFQAARPASVRPIITRTGPGSSAAASRAGNSAIGAAIVAWSGRVARATATAGMAGSRPAAI